MVKKIQRESWESYILPSNLSLRDLTFRIFSIPSLCINKYLHSPISLLRGILCFNYKFKSNFFKCFEYYSFHFKINFAHLFNKLIGIILNWINTHPENTQIINIQLSDLSQNKSTHLIRPKFKTDYYLFSQKSCKLKQSPFLLP